MPRHRIAASTLFLALALVHAPAAAPGGEPVPRRRVHVETSVSFTANLVHWVDNLAGTSMGKTMPSYRRYWEERFGPMDAEDRLALEAFARARRAPVVTSGFAVSNESGCLPVGIEGLGWRQIFLAEAMAADSPEDLRSSLSNHLGEREVAAVMATLERFRRRFERVWRDLGHVRRFESKFQRYLARGPMMDYLDSLARFFDVSPGPDRPMYISFIGLPTDGPTHAEADGDRLLIEIRPGDTPAAQVQVVAHEASHFLMHQMSAGRIDALAREAFSEGEAGALFWRYIWEGIPTALGQGVAEARLTPASFSLDQRWYHLDTIDRFAKLIYPVMSGAIGSSRRIDEGVAPPIARILRESSLLREAHAAEFLMTAFYASGDGLESDLQLLRRKAGLRDSAGSLEFELGDPAGPEWLRRYTCLGGLAVVTPAELPRAANLDGTALLAETAVKQAQELAERGAGVIVAGRRPAGGPVYFVVTSRGRLGEPLMDAFARLRGLPDRALLVTAGP